MSKKKIYLADITYFNQYTDPQITIPLNIGFIQSYANKYYSDHFEFKLFKDPKKLIKEICSSPPDILGLSCYYWNMQFDVYAAKYVKEKNPNAVVIAGGPQIDFKHGDMSFKAEQFKLHEEFNGYCDFYVINEGELAFNNFLERFLICGHEKVFDEPINGGVHFINSHDYLGGSYLGVDIDLNEIPSPILSGSMDDFLTEDFMPMMQSSRLCPYMCTFCSSGKLRGKIRGFSIETIKNEIDYIADIYKTFAYKRLWISDENFGILKRDTEIAEYLYRSKANKGYPQGVKLYFDKKFQSNSMKASLHLADMESDGVTLAFQTLNKETLKAIKRVNLSNEEIDTITKWAHKHNFPISTQLIQGLPFETKETFMDTIEYLFQKKVDSIGIFQCMLFKGAELNRSDSREEYEIITKWRPCYLPSYDQINSEFICEAEEIIVSNKWMSFDDYLDLNKIGFMSYLFTVSEYFSRLVNYLINHTDIHIVNFFNKIMNPDDRSIIDADYKIFLDDYDKERTNELSETYEEAKQKMEHSFKENNYTIGTPSRLNVLFASRLIYKEKNWFANVIRDNLEKYNLEENDLIILNDLISICDSEWVSLDSINSNENLIVHGMTYKYLGLIDNYNGIAPTKKYEIKLSVSNDQKKLLHSYMDKYKNKEIKNKEHLTNALDFISPRRRLRYEKIILS